MQKFALVFSCLLIAGCTAQQLEDRFNDGSAPPGSPPGYYSFQRGHFFEKQNNLDMAQLYYCNSAKLGYPDGQAPCVYYSLHKAATQNAYAVCDGAPYDTETKNICDKYWSNGVQKTAQLSAQLFQVKDAQLKQRLEQRAKMKEQQAQMKAIHENIKAKKYDLKEEDF